MVQVGNINIHTKMVPSPALEGTCSVSQNGPSRLTAYRAWCQIWTTDEPVRTGIFFYFRTSMSWCSSFQHATLLLDAALEERNWQLARDLVRFLKAIGEWETLVLNPCGAELILGNIKLFFFLPFLNIAVTHLMKLLPQRRQAPTYITQPISWQGVNLEMWNDMLL